MGVITLKDSQMYGVIPHCSHYTYTHIHMHKV